jgi:glycerophosphoryl diester phosphodiesterase/ankyrin repeat protein
MASRPAVAAASCTPPLGAHASIFSYIHELTARADEYSLSSLCGVKGISRLQDALRACWRALLAAQWEAGATADAASIDARNPTQRWARDASSVDGGAGATSSAGPPAVSVAALSAADALGEPVPSLRGYHRHVAHASFAAAPAAMAAQPPAHAAALAQLRAAWKALDARAQQLQAERELRRAGAPAGIGADGAVAAAGTSPHDRLCNALRDNDCQAAGRLLQLGELEPPVVLALAGPLLHLLIDGGDADGVRQLVALGVPLGLPDLLGRSPLQHALRAGRPAVTAALLASGAEWRGANAVGRNVLHSTVVADQPGALADLVVALLPMGADGHPTPAAFAHASQLAALLRAEDAQQATPVYCACALDRPACLATLLLAARALQALTGDSSLVASQLVVSQGAASAVGNIAAFAARWALPYVAAHADAPECLKLVLAAASSTWSQVEAAAGADGGVATDAIVHLAALAANAAAAPGAASPVTGAAVVLVNTAVGVAQTTALHAAAAKGFTRCSELLLAAGANPCARDASGGTPCHAAVEHGHAATLAVLLAAALAEHDAGATLLATPGPSPWLPLLQLAVVAGSADCARVLLGAGARPTDEDAGGWSALALALYYGDRPLAALMRAHKTLATTRLPPLLRSQLAEGEAGAPVWSELRAEGPRRTQPVDATVAAAAVTLTPGRWQLHLSLGAQATVPGTQPQAAISLTADAAVCGTAMGLAEAARPHARVLVRTAGDISVPPAAATAVPAAGYAVSLPLRPTAQAGWASPVLSDLRSARHACIRLAAPPPQPGAALGGCGLAVYGDAMVFTAATPDAFNLQLDVAVASDVALPSGAAVPDNGGTSAWAGQRRAPQPDSAALVAAHAPHSSASAPHVWLGRASLPSELLMGVSTAHATPYSAGLENLPPPGDAAFPAATGGGPQPMRLNGQLVLPVMGGGGRGTGGGTGGAGDEPGGDEWLDIHSAPQPLRVLGFVTVRYLLVRGYEPPPSQVVAPSAAAAPPPLAPAPLALPSPAQPPAAAHLQPNATAGAGAAVASPAGSEMPSPATAAFWSRMHVFGHRGSGADNAATVALGEGQGAPPPQTALLMAAAMTAAATAAAAAAGPGAGAAPVSLLLNSPPGPASLPAGSPPAVPASSASSVTTRGSSANGAPTRVRRTHVLENTLLSLTTAARAGAEYVELDVQLSRDGVPVIHHDWGVKVPLVPEGGDGGPPAMTMRVPVTHLTVAQLKAIEPQAMVGDLAADEYAMARAADAAATQRPFAAARAAGAARPAGPPSGFPELDNAHLQAMATAPLAATEAASASASGGGGGGGGDAGLQLVRAPSSASMSSADGGGAGVLLSPTSAKSEPVLPPAAAHAAHASAPSTALTTTPGAGAGARPPRGAPRRLRVAPSSSGSTTGGGGSGGLTSPLKSPEYRYNSRMVSSLGLEADRLDLTRLALSYYYGLRDRFATLEEVLTRLPPAAGVNIEVKYATVAESHAFGLRQWERNAFVERILDVVFALAGGRGILFSSFDPDVCLLLRCKQAAYPVLLLTEAGTPEEPLTDPRMNSLAAAVAFARGARLFGIVSHVGPLLECPRIIHAIQDEAGLVLCTYGRANNTADAVLLQQAHGVGAVIVDHVAHITRTLKASP